MNQSQFELIIDWMTHITKLDSFDCFIYFDSYRGEDIPELEYGDPESPRCYDPFWDNEYWQPTVQMYFHIYDEEKVHLMLIIPLDGISSTYAYFSNRHHEIYINGYVDLSIIEHLKRLIERIPDSVFKSEISAAIYYSNTGNFKKAKDYIRLYLDSEHQPSEYISTGHGLYDIVKLNRAFPAKFKNTDEFKRLLRSLMSTEKNGTGS